jgi:hypothetical protein
MTRTGADAYALELDDETRRFAVRLELDRENVFEDSPVGVVLTIEGKPTAQGDQLQAVTCGPMQFAVDIPIADAVVTLKLAEAETIRDALTRLLEAA